MRHQSRRRKNNDHLIHINNIRTKKQCTIKHNIDVVSIYMYVSTSKSFALTSSKSTFETYRTRISPLCDKTTTATCRGENWTPPNLVITASLDPATATCLLPATNKRARTAEDQSKETGRITQSSIKAAPLSLTFVGQGSGVPIRSTALF